ncbi:MAG: cytochrome c3 family protein [Bacteroidota bacterium]|nr:cytochrome c3 family protein [Bacteroidota bacterium]
MKKNLYIAAVVLSISALIVFGRGRAVASEDHQLDKKQLIKFSHQKHLGNGVECLQCHKADLSEKSSDRILPTHEECKTCHEQEVQTPDQCKYCHVGEAPYLPLPKSPREITFNHKKHIADQGLKCETCHQNLDKVDFANAQNLPSMSTCVSCHNNVKATSQCENCHTNLASLRPASHNVTNFKREHARIMNLRSFDAKCQNCHTEQSCAECHDGTNLTTLTPKEKTGMLAPRVSGTDKPKALVGETVHGLNYQFTHGIDAKGKANDCQTCHRSQEFCADCHINGSAALGGVVPTSHERVGFTTIGVGSGGGKHAQLAKRDIQSCMSCHDVEGGDPTCITCHIDPDGVKGNNPRTHAGGFMKSNRGDWHDDMAANCYVCHTDPNAKPNGKSGQGFCGYCHGAK